IQRMDQLRHALVLGGVGVGGGSLVYGNTLFEPPARFFDDPTVRMLGGAERLRPYYGLARRMLGVVPNPYLGEVDQALQAAAAEMGRGETFTPSPVAVFTGSAGQSASDPYFLGQGPDRVGCTQCGGCFLGCRVDAKNTLDRNYLFLAETLGCEIVPETRVTGLIPLGPRGADGYEVRAVESRWFGRACTFRTRAVVVAGGVLGTVGLLLKCREQGALPYLSSRLGHGVRTNSETLVGARVRNRGADLSRGLAASSSVFPDEHTQVQADRMPAGADGMAWLSTVMVDGGGRLPRWLRWVTTVLRHPLDFLRTLWPFGYARQTVMLVVMQDLDSQLRLVLRRSWWWPFRRHVQSEVTGPRVPSYIPEGNAFARRLARRLDAVPLSATNEVLLDVPVTAHVMGGCGIGLSSEEGVLDPGLKVHGYANLWVCDGSVLPANLGVNPALTIAAFAESAMARVPPNDEQIHWLAVDEAWGVRELIWSGA
ncbi:MAG: GMC oxidoreductase, partial [Myxococcota bacterium]|nr:GMC oxidoreductase [Myxococcota bacterium]